MDVACNLVIEFDDEQKVETVLKSVKVDDFDFVKSTVEGRTLKAEIKSKSVSSLIHTLDDYLACMSVAIKLVDKD